jgi:hypothetical protein
MLPAEAILNRWIAEALIDHRRVIKKFALTSRHANSPCGTSRALTTRQLRAA